MASVGSVRALARQTFPDAHIIDLLDERRYQSLAANPALLGLELRALPANQVVVLDEVQHVPALLNEVHRAIEGTRRRFVLLGSSARRLKTADTNLLAGRAALRTMYPLVPAELRSTLEVYVQLYVREEIRIEALVRNLPAFLRFLPVAALFHGQVINIAGLRAMPPRRERRSRDILAFCTTRWWRRCCRHSRQSYACENGNTRNSTGSIRGWLAPL